MKPITTYLVRFLIIFTALGIVAGLSSCNTEKRCEKEINDVQTHCPELFTFHDTTFHKTLVRETKTTDTILLPGATQTFTTVIPCPTSTGITFKHHFKTGTASFQIMHDTVTVNCPYDSLMEVIRQKTDSITILQTTLKTGIATKIVKSPLSGFDNFCHWLVILAACGAGLFFGGKYLLPIIIKALKL